MYLVAPVLPTPRIVNLDVWAWHVIDHVRQEATRNPDERLEALVTELTKRVPDRLRGDRDRIISASRSRCGFASATPSFGC
ncbi:hypothetical protein [Streptosporangium sp. G12]